jgi:glyoxylase-like metal-dependent hydrolase (beta-lactamase superfamily II)
MFFKQISAGGDRNFSYIVADNETREAAIIDPAFSPEEELEILKRENLKLTYIINTHDHFDHTGGNAVLAGKTGAKIAMHESARSHHDISLKDGDILRLGSLELRIIHTPGHTYDSVCVLAGNDLMTGDTLFVGKVGGTGYGQDARNEYESLHTRLMKLPPKTRVWPGHDYGVRPSSTIGDELRENPFILRDSFESFVELKGNWLEYKRIHGIK